MPSHPPQEAGPPPHSPRWIAMAWVAVLSVVAWRHVPVAHASHSHTGSTQLHISTIHGNNGTATTPGSLDEQYCIQSHTSTISQTQMANFIEETLVKMGTASMWDSTNNWKVDLWRATPACNLIDSTARASIGTEYHINTDWTNIPLCGTYYSCVVHDNPVYDATGGHTHYKWMYSYLQAEHVNGYGTRARKFINHETGHVLGLKDPAGYGTDCQDSVMHNDLYGCPSTVWYPTANDRAAVTRIGNYQNTW